jgi:hypothetical protein
VLFDMTGFHCWEGGALWHEIKFDIKHYADIERIAALGDRRWQHGMAAFFTPFTKAPRLATLITPTPRRRGNGWTELHSGKV